ncbi:MAG: hypothetical protein PVF63_02215 [Gammaproteobacteria bacterium]
MNTGIFARRAVVTLLAWLPGATAFAQVDFTGNWAPLYHEDNPERIPGPELGDYAGIPINDAARLRADSYIADRISAVTEYQCRPHGGDYSMRGLANMRVDDIRDPITQQVIAIHLRMNFQDMERTIWLDGREHPGPLEPHTFAGFSTGEWNRNMLNVYTTHLKKSYLRRNGLARSELATFTDHWVRHGKYLTITTTIEDPAFLTEPLVRSQTWVFDPTQQMGRDVCRYTREIPGPINRVPHFLPGENPYLEEIIEWYGLPLRGVRGGADTIYPEYRDVMELPPNPPEVCTLYCECGQDNSLCL